MCGTGIRARNGSGRRAASASSIPASTPFRSSRRIMPQPIFVKQATLEFPANRDAPIAAKLVFASGLDGEDLRAVVRLAPDRSADLGHRDRDGGRASTCLLIERRRRGSRSTARWWWTRIPPNTRAFTGSFDALLKAGAVRCGRHAVPARGGRFHDRQAGAGGGVRELEKFLMLRRAKPVSRAAQLRLEDRFETALTRFLRMRGVER